MNLNDFVQKYAGQRVAKTDGGYLGECASLVQRYFAEVCGYNYASMGNGGDVADNLIAAGLADRVSTAQFGDVISYALDGAGDVQISLGGSATFEQNVPTGSACHVGNIWAPIRTIARPRFQDRIGGAQVANYDVNKKGQLPMVYVIMNPDHTLSGEVWVLNQNNKWNNVNDAEKARIHAATDGIKIFKSDFDKIAGDFQGSL